MQPTQFSSWAVYMGNQPILFGALRYAKTSTGQTLRQKPHALHMSSPTTTSQRQAGPSRKGSGALLVRRHRLVHVELGRLRPPGHQAARAQRVFHRARVVAEL